MLTSMYKRVISISTFTVCLVLSTCLIKSSHASNLNAQKEALTVIADYADRICKDIPMEGKKSDLELSGMAKAELENLLKKLATLGISGSGKWNQESYKGLLQKDIAFLLTVNIECRRDISKRLEEQLLSASPSTDKSNHDLAESKENADSYSAGNPSDAIFIPSNVAIIYVHLQRPGLLVDGSSELLGAFNRDEFVRYFEEFRKMAHDKGMRLMIAAATDGEKEWLHNKIMYRNKHLKPATWRDTPSHSNHTGVEIPLN